MKHAVIYAFRSPGSGAVYIGKHQCCPEGWPRRGNGCLPDGYRGSGVAVTNFHTRHGAALQWRILAVVYGGRDAVNAAERRAIRLARALFGRKCVNRADGGDGQSSEAFKQIWAKPEARASLSAQSKARAQTPEGAAQLARFLAAAKTPEALAKISASNKAWAQTQQGKSHFIRIRAAALAPEALGRLSATLKARAQTPEGTAGLARAQQIGQRKHRARKALAPFRRQPALQSPGLTVWHAPSGSPLGIAGLSQR